ncbi:GTPase KRas isoform X2 [Eurytemora carolleeae]|nr:GTPase KRas isoform X2 [Eurytemora carolleeae]|eukprot:XP_023347766.1 GTPase KRas-like isoform X2 [Eurytemora affinis]
MLHNKYMETYDPTIEDFYYKENFMVDGEPTNMEILDTAGQDNVIGTRDQYYKNAEGFLFVYSVSDSLSMKDVEDRIQGMKTARGIPDNTELPPTIIIGNKCDLPTADDQSKGEVRKVSRSDGEELARNYGVFFEETSAKADINVKKVFEDIVRELKDQERKILFKPKKKSKKRCTIC